MPTVTLTPPDESRMTPDERRSAFSLASIYALRMLGLFMVMPVFMLEARHYEGGDDLSTVGMAMGVYGLVQAVLQIPFGMAADRFGRKRVIYLGLALLALGSIIGAMATSVNGLAWGRALQGGGAISAAVTALLADQTRDAVRTKGTALVGGSIGLMFALSLVLGPVLSGWGRLERHFWRHPVVGLERRGHCAVLDASRAGLALGWCRAAQPVGLAGAPRFGSFEFWRVCLVCRATGLLGGHSCFADPSRCGQRRPRMGLPSRGAAVLCGHGRDSFPLGATRPVAALVFGLHCVGDAGASLLGRVGAVPTAPVATCLLVVFVFLRLQCFRGQPTQLGLALGAHRLTRCGFGRLQHLAIVGHFCGRCDRRLVAQKHGRIRRFPGQRGADVAVAAGSLAQPLCHHITNGCGLSALRSRPAPPHNQSIPFHSTQEVNPWQA